MNRRLANILAFLLPAALAYWVGVRALARHLVDWNSLAAAAHAYDVFHRLPQANMALIGFVQPPLPAALYLPLSYLCPGWLASGGTAPLLGALFLGFSAVMLVHLGQALRLRWWVYAPLTAIFCVHPLVLSYAALGHPAILLIFAYLGLAKGLVGWHREQTVRDLVAAAIYGAVAILIAYEAVIPVLAAALFILNRCQPRRTCHDPTPLEPAKPEGTLIAFLLPAAYVAAVWLVANWAIMGNPLHFWQMTLAGTQRLPLSPVDDWLQPIITVALVVQPLLLALIYHDLRVAPVSRLGAPVAWLALAAFAGALLLPTLRTTATGTALWAPLMPLAAAAAGFGFPLLLILPASYAAVASEWRRKLFTAGFVIIAVGSLVVAFHLQSTNQGLPTGLRSTFSGYAASAHTDIEERAAAERLRGQLQPVRNYIAGWPGFAIALYGRFGERLEVLPTTEPPADDLGLQAGSTVVLLTNGHDAHTQWQARLPQFLALREQWREGKWVGYRVVVRPLL